jgi:hypothetical protein
MYIDEEAVNRRPVSGNIPETATIPEFRLTLAARF